MYCYTHNFDSLLNLLCRALFQSTAGQKPLQAVSVMGGGVVCPIVAMLVTVRVGKGERGYGPRWLWISLATNVCLRPRIGLWVAVFAERCADNCATAPFPPYAWCHLNCRDEWRCLVPKVALSPWPGAEPRAVMMTTTTTWLQSLWHIHLPRL